jgi:hypothetical protein
MTTDLRADPNVPILFVICRDYPQALVKIFTFNIQFRVSGRNATGRRAFFPPGTGVF